MPAGVETWLQANVAVATAISNNRPVLLTVPLSVMAPWSPRTMAPLPRSRKLDSLSAGLPLRIIRFPWVDVVVLVGVASAPGRTCPERGRARSIHAGRVHRPARYWRAAARQGLTAAAGVPRITGLSRRWRATEARIGA